MPAWNARDRRDLAAVRDEIRGWIPAATDSPLYVAIAEHILEDEPMLELVAQIENVPPLNLLFGGVQLLLAEDDALADWYPRLGGDRTVATLADADAAYAAFREFTLPRAEMLIEIGVARRTQTNEVRRAAVIMPFIAAAIGDATGPVHAIDIGAAAGLVTCLDRYAYDFGAGIIGDSSLVLTCENRGGFEMPDAVPAFASRTALDLAPVEVDDPEQVAWLEALIWPEHEERLQRFRAALEIRRATAPRVLAGDAATTLPGAVEGLDGTIVLFHTIALYQMPPERSEALDDVIATLARERHIVRVAFEPRPGWGPDVRVALKPSHTPAVAVGHAHGAWIDRP